jgi:hypothetical protein
VSLKKRSGINSKIKRQILVFNEFKAFKIILKLL